MVDLIHLIIWPVPRRRCETECGKRGGQKEVEGGDLCRIVMTTVTCQYLRLFMHAESQSDFFFFEAAFKIKRGFLPAGWHKSEQQCRRRREEGIPFRSHADSTCACSLALPNFLLRVSVRLRLLPNCEIFREKQFAPNVFSQESSSPPRN